MSDTVEVTDEARAAYANLTVAFAGLIEAMAAAESAGVDTGAAIGKIMRENMPAEALEAMPPAVRMLLG